MSSDDLGEKHLSLEARRRRFDPASRYGGHGGRTLVKTMRKADVSVDGYRDTYLKIKRPTDPDGNVLVSDLDKELQELLHTDSDGKIVESAPGGHWFRLPLLLEESCISKKTERDNDCPDVIITTYTVPGVSWLAPDAEEKEKLDRRRKERLALARADGHTVLCRLRDTPPEEIMEPSLLGGSAKLTSSVGNAKEAKVLAENSHKSWCPPTADLPSSYLEVDLGTTCLVTYVSTQGRFPPIVPRPSQEPGMRIVNEGHPECYNWVTAYELLYRVESGHDWVELGEFRANTDMTTEVAHDLLRVCKGKLECRYLRFRPLTYHKLPAMRVGVYGECLHPARGAKDKDPDKDLIVQYSICCIKASTNTRRAPRTSCSNCTYGCVKCSKTRGVCKKGGVTSTQRRMRLRSGTVEEVRKLQPDPPLEESLQNREVLDALAEEEEDEVSQPRGLTRMRSFSDPELSTAGSSTLGDSIVVVPEPWDLESHDWIVLQPGSPAEGSRA